MPIEGEVGVIWREDDSTFIAVFEDGECQELRNKRGL